MAPRSSHRHLPPWQVVVSLAALFASAIAIVVVCAFVKFERSEIAWDLFHDLGVALFISAVVGGLFEVYRSARHQVETMRDVIDVTMGEQITPAVWLEIRDLLHQRAVIRRNVHLRWSLRRTPSLSAPAGILQQELEYELYALTPKAVDYTIEHELDYHLRNKDLDLPRFERIVIVPPGSEPIVQTRSNLEQAADPCKFSFNVSVPQRDAEPLRVRVERFELVYAPGSYNLYTPEFIKGLYIHYGECPRDIEPEISARSLGPRLKLKHSGNDWACEHLFLPGQGIEIKFLTKPTPNHM